MQEDREQLGGGEMTKEKKMKSGMNVMSSVEK
jgi:hypothetical protein